VSISIPNPIDPSNGYIYNDWQNSNYQSNQFKNMGTLLSNMRESFLSVAGGPNSTNMVSQGAAGSSALLSEANGWLAAAMSGDPQATLMYQHTMQMFKNLYEATSNGNKAMSDAMATAIRNARP